MPEVFSRNDHLVGDPVKRKKNYSVPRKPSERLQHWITRLQGGSFGRPSPLSKISKRPLFLEMPEKIRALCGYPTRSVLLQESGELLLHLEVDDTLLYDLVIGKFND